MEHTVKDYLEHLPTEKLKMFLRQHAAGILKEDYSYMIPMIQAELLRRETRNQDGN